MYYKFDSSIVLTLKKKKKKETAVRKQSTKERENVTLEVLRL